MSRDDAIRALVTLGVPISLASAVPRLPADARGLLLYGSRARGDSVEDSDLDLLALVAAPRPSRHIGDVSISYYTLEQLYTGIGTLFGAHLKRDSKIIFDDDGSLGASVDAMGGVDTERLFDRVRRLSELFSSSDHDVPKHLPGLARAARFLLRTCLYAQAISIGRPCFSVRELANRASDEDLIWLLAARQGKEPSSEDYDALLVRLRGIIGNFPASRNGSLEATVVNLWGKPGDLLALAFLALDDSGGESDYAEVKRILL